MCIACVVLGFILLTFGISMTMTQLAIVSVPCILVSIWIFIVLGKKLKKRCAKGKCGL